MSPPSLESAPSPTNAPEYPLTSRAFEVEEPCRLRQGQLQSGHLVEFGADPSEEVGIGILVEVGKNGGIRIQAVHLQLLV